MNLLIIGDIFIDTHTDLSEKKINRIGGIFHSVRTLNAFGKESSIIYCASEYMNEHVKKYQKKLRIKDAYHCFDRKGSPGIFLIDHSNELHDNRYEYILDGEEVINTLNENISKINFSNFTDALVYPGSYNLDMILDLLNENNINIHIDMQYESLDKIFKYNIDTLFISVSSEVINETVKDYIKKNRNCETIVLKENRGGSKIIIKDGSYYETPAFLLGSMHSVGVGDAYNSSFLLHRDQGYSIEDSSLKASYTASLYSLTLHYETFIESLAVLDSYTPDKINGVRVDFSKRKYIHIYIAGPDFKDSKYTNYFDKIYEIIQYHNFNGHLPIRENGDGAGKSSIEQSKMYKADIELLDKCQIMIACGFENDSGTMAEIGYFKANKKPIILLDINKEVNNMFIRHTVDKIVYSLDELLDTLYRTAEGIEIGKV